MVWKMMFKGFQDGCSMLDPLWHLNWMISAFLCNLSACCRPSSFYSRGYMVWKMMMFEEFQDGCWVLGNRWYANGMIKAISESPCCRKTSTKFLLKRIYGLEDVGWRIPRLLFSARQSLVCKCDDFSYLMLEPPWHLTGMNSAFLCNLSACCLPSSFCSRGYMFWKMMMFEEFQDGCLVLDNLSYANETI